jgi:hypothetical protein
MEHRKTKWLLENKGEKEKKEAVRSPAASF